MSWAFQNFNPIEKILRIQKVRFMSKVEIFENKWKIWDFFEKTSKHFDFPKDFNDNFSIFLKMFLRFFFTFDINLTFWILNIFSIGLKFWNAHDISFPRNWWFCSIWGREKFIFQKVYIFFTFLHLRNPTPRKLS